MACRPVDTVGKLLRRQNDRGLAELAAQAAMAFVAKTPERAVEVPRLRSRKIDGNPQREKRRVRPAPRAAAECPRDLRPRLPRSSPITSTRCTVSMGLSIPIASAASFRAGAGISFSFRRSGMAFMLKLLFIVTLI